MDTEKSGLRKSGGGARLKGKRMLAEDRLGTLARRRVVQELVAKRRRWRIWHTRCTD
jgi:hypothetical protein